MSLQGSLSLRNGVLYVGRHERTAHVRAYDLGGRPLSPGFSFRSGKRERAAVSGIDVDHNHAIWIADGASSKVRGFTLAGAEVRTIGSDPRCARDAPGSLEGLVDVLAVEEQDEVLLWVACDGMRRHGVQLIDGQGAWIRSLRSEGDPLREFRDVCRIASHGPMTYVCEARAGRVQVFRNGDFHYLFRVPAAPGSSFQPHALAPLSDGRAVVATGGRSSSLLLVDTAGRLERVLAEHGVEDGRVFEPGDVAVEWDSSGCEHRVAVIDRDAERVQVFTLEGRCAGSVEALPGEVL